MASFGGSVSLDESITNAWVDITDDANSTAWCVIGLDGKKLTVTARGEGGRSECFAAIADDSTISFGAFKVLAIDGPISIGNPLSMPPMSYRNKYVIFFYRAPNAGAMAKARASQHFSLVEGICHGHHLSFSIDALHELSEAEVVKKLRACGGAHAPTGFDFGHGDVGEGAEEEAPSAAPATNPADMAQNAKFDGKLEQVTEGVSKVAVSSQGDSGGGGGGGGGSGSGSAGPPPTTAATTARAAGVVGGEEGTTHSQALMAAAMRETALPDSSGGASSNGRTVVMLVTSMPSTTIIEGNQASLRNIFKGKLKVTIAEVDGVLEENKATRSTLFACSGKRGSYPQVFIREKDGETYSFVGDFEEVQSITDSDSLPPDVLAAHPDIPTFSKIFAEFM